MDSEVFLENESMGDSYCLICKKCCNYCSILHILSRISWARYCIIGLHAIPFSHGLLEFFAVSWLA